MECSRLVCFWFDDEEEKRTGHNLFKVLFLFEKQSELRFSAVTPYRVREKERERSVAVIIAWLRWTEVNESLLHRSDLSSINPLFFLDIF